MIKFLYIYKIVNIFVIVQYALHKILKTSVA